MPKKAQKEEKRNEKKTKSKQVCEIVNTFAMYMYIVHTKTDEWKSKNTQKKNYRSNNRSTTIQIYNKVAEKYERKKNNQHQHSLHAKIKRQQ